jgi:hypothetical protein
MDEVMNTVNEVMVQLTKGFSRKHAPEIKEETLYTRGFFFVKYALEMHKIRGNPRYKLDTKITRVPMSE